MISSFGHYIIHFLLFFFFTLFGEALLNIFAPMLRDISFRVFCLCVWFFLCVCMRVSISGARIMLAS